MTLIHLGHELMQAYEQDLDQGTAKLSGSDVRLAAYAIETAIRLREQSHEILETLSHLRAQATEFETTPVERVRLSLRLLNSQLADYLHQVQGSVICPIQYAEALRIPRTILTRLHQERGLSA